MKIITREYKVYEFDELKPEAQNKALVDLIEFQIDIMTEESPFYKYAVQMEKQQTPWFLAEMMFHEGRQTLIDIIKANEYTFLENGELFNE